MPRRKLYHRGDYRRLHDVSEKGGDARDPFRRDLARLIHCPAFRRLQGKTQLFPNGENDFFRNRLTHSIEVSQIATGIAQNLNASVLSDDPINEHLVSFAALAHDLGHPPFGHNGEKALDELMSGHGGFEGNAQTLRILCRLEKKETREFPYPNVVANPFNDESKDIRLGLNLTMRSLASVLKYDREIPITDEDVKKKGYDRPVKGYYSSEDEVVQEIVDSVEARSPRPGFKTIECSIMDVADDIAYSTYDLEDAFKAGFLSPIEMAAAPAELKDEIATEINSKLKILYAGTKNYSEMDVKEVDDILGRLFRTTFDYSSTSADAAYEVSRRVYHRSRILAGTGYYRTALTSKFVHEFICDVEFTKNTTFPSLSKVRLKIDTFKEVELLKKFAYKSLIMSPMLKMAENSSGSIIERIFHTLVDAKTGAGRRLLPTDWREVYFGISDPSWRMRTVCDFIASMTDRYCLEFYSRITGSNPPSIHKPFQ